jgi:MYXO-CTERM domain-containing protein
MQRAIKPLLAATLLAAAGLASANDGRTHDGSWLADHVAAQGSFAAAAQTDDALAPAWAAHDAQAAATDTAPVSPAYALTLAGLAMMGVLVRRRRRDTF